MSKTWLITGSSRGIGAAIATAAYQSGDNVVATGNDLEELQRTFAGFEGRLLTALLDVTEPDQAVKTVELAIAKFGSIDVLVNNAGYGQLGLFEENDLRDIERQFATNIFGVFYVTRAVLPAMRAARKGHIFNISAIGGFVGYPHLSLYSSTKFAVEGFSESLAGEVSEFGIRITIVEPGFMRTGFLDATSVRFGSREVAGYLDGSSKARQFAAENNHTQGGDPVKLAAAIVRLSEETEPPLRFLAGSDAVALAAEKLETLRKEFLQWRDLSLSTNGDFEGSPQNAA
jgi:NAD(P)-dependent dehydrogenase (short-subunit alcohol dehydrogenase family)